MSLWSRDPLKYEEIVQKGILCYIMRCVDGYGATGPHDWVEGYEVFIEAIQHDPQLRGVYNELLRLADVDILQAEQEYISSKVDERDRVT